MARLRLGRKGPLVWSYLQLAVSGAATAYFSSFSAYCVFRFLVGTTFSGIILNSLSLGESPQGGALREGGQGRGLSSPTLRFLTFALWGVLIQGPQLRASHPGLGKTWALIGGPTSREPWPLGCDWPSVG